MRIGNAKTEGYHQVTVINDEWNNEGREWQKGFGNVNEFVEAYRKGGWNVEVTDRDDEKMTATVHLRSRCQEVVPAPDVSADNIEAVESAERGDYGLRSVVLVVGAVLVWIVLAALASVK